jgi:uncharacterized DUF497 family protein
MVDMDAIVGFEWDSGNERKSVDKHDVSQAQAEQIFFNLPLLVSEDVGHSDSEPRFHAMGRSDDGRALHVSFTLRAGGMLIRVISARPMSRKERVYYEKEA